MGDEAHTTAQPRFRLGEHEDWLPAPAVQRLLDILHERNRPYLGALLAEALTGEPPKIRRSS